MSYDAGDVMDTAASLLNDAGKSLFSYIIQLPYLQMAHEELEQHFILEEVPLSLIDETIITVPAGDTELELPASFFIPIRLEEQTTDGRFVPMRQRKFVNTGSPEQTASLYTWDFRHNCVNFVGSTSEINVRLVYWRKLPIVVTDASAQYMDGGRNALSFRTAALCARYIGGDIAAERANELNAESVMARDLLIGIYVKNSQALRSRRKPFRMHRGYR